MAMISARTLTTLGLVLIFSVAIAASQAKAETHRVLVIPFQFNETPVVITKSDGNTRELNFNVPPRRTASGWQSFFAISMMDEYLTEVSYGKKSLSITVLINPATATGWFPAPHTVSEYFDTKHPKQGAYKPLNDITEIASKSGVDLNQYDAFVAFGNQSSSGAQTQGSLGKTGKPVILFNEIKLDSDVVATLLHEIVHTLLPGVDIDVYGDGSALADGTLPGSCGATSGCQGSATTISTDNYADWDLMANHSALTHPSLITKLKAGWIEPKSIYQSPVHLSKAPYSNQIPLTAISAPGAAPLGIELLYSDKNAPKAGYFVECRRKIGRDTGIPKEGVLVTELGKGKCNRPARVISGSPVALNSLCQAPLSGTDPNPESIVDSARGLMISGFAYGTDRCLVDIIFTNGKAPDVSFTYTTYKKYGGSSFWGSTDIWIDTVANGLDAFPPYETIDSTGAPAGQGDFPIVGMPAKVMVRVRNKGTSDAHNIRIQLSASLDGPFSLAPSVCSPGKSAAQPGAPPEIIGESLVAFLPAGEETVRSIDWTPKAAKPAKLTARVVSFDEFALDPNKGNDATHETVIVSDAGGPADATIKPKLDSASILVKNPCLIDKVRVRLVVPKPPIPKPEPDPQPEPYFDDVSQLSDSAWRLSFDSISEQLESQSEAQFNYRVTSRLRNARGYFALPIAMHSFQDQGWPLDADDFEPRSIKMTLSPLVGAILDPSAITCALAPSQIRDRVSVTGRLRPGKANESMIIKISPQRTSRIQSRATYQEIRTEERGAFSFDLPSDVKANAITVHWPGDLTTEGASAECQLNHSANKLTPAQ